MIIYLLNGKLILYSRSNLPPNYTASCTRESWLSHQDTWVSVQLDVEQITVLLVCVSPWKMGISFKPKGLCSSKADSTSRHSTNNKIDPGSLIQETQHPVCNQAVWPVRWVAAG